MKTDLLTLWDKISSSHFLVTVGFLFSLAYVGEKQLPLLWFAVYFNAGVYAFVMARIFAKKNRGQFQSGFKARELYVSAVGIAGTVWMMNHGLSAIWGWGFITGGVVLYLIGRGVTHSIGVKTQMVMR